MSAAEFRLGEWVVGPTDGSLSSTGTTTRLEPLLMALLVFLCTRPHQVIAKRELLAHVWGGRFVSDDTVKAAFYQLRKALGDSARCPRYIETLPKRGYRVLMDPIPLDDERCGQAGPADDLCRRGNALLTGRPEAAALMQARVYFESALEADPHHTGALPALALVYVHLAELGSGGELMARARAIAQQAVSAAARSAAGHTALAITTLLQDRDVAAAERLFRTALALEPQHTMAHRWYAKLLSFSGRHEEAVAEARSAVSADPHSIVCRRDLAETLFMARRSGEAIDEARRLLRRFPQATDVQLGLTWLYWTIGDERRAFDAVYAGFMAAGVARSVLDGSVRAFQEGGMEEVLRRWAEILEGQAALGRKALDLVVLYALLGENDRAFELIDGLLRMSHPAILWIPVSPLFDRLRPDVRYRRVLSQLTAAASDR